MDISDKLGILFLHGYTGGRYELEPLFQYLKSRYEFEYEFPVYPGHGFELNFKDVTGDDWYDEAFEAYQELSAKVDRMYIVGFSMGGLFASHIAEHHKVDKLLLIAPAFEYTHLNRLSRLNLRPEGLGEHLKMKTMDVVKSRLPKLSIRAFNEFRMIMDAKMPDYEKIKSETLLVHGKIDLLVPYLSSVEAANKIENSRLELIEDAPHVMSYTENHQHTLNMVAERFLFAGTKKSS